MKIAALVCSLFAALLLYWKKFETTVFPQVQYNPVIIILQKSRRLNKFDFKKMAVDTYGERYCPYLSTKIISQHEFQIKYMKGYYAIDINIHFAKGTKQVARW
jgi:hypothetical protein